MRFPVNDPYKITTYFSSVHPGLDIAPIPAGSSNVSCYAPENATVKESTTGVVEGQYIKLKGDSGMYYYFGHFSKRLVGVGDKVSEGQAIGILGMTGQADGVHTHHEVRKTSTGGQLDPLEYYKKGDNMDELKQQIKDLEARVNLQTYQLADYARENGGLRDALEGERKGYAVLLKENEELKASKGNCTVAERQLLDLLKGLRS